MSRSRVYFLDFRGGSSFRGDVLAPGGLWKKPQSFLDSVFGTGNARGADWPDLRKEQRVTFLVHGFNVSREAGQTALSRLANDMPSIHNGAIVVVTWPGDHSMVPINFASYLWRKNDANDCGREFERFCKRSLAPDAILSFVSHSLGARVVMESMSRLQDRFTIDRVCLMAAAIDDDSLADPDQYRQAVKAAGRVAVLASEKDFILQQTYQPGQHPVRTLLAPGSLFLTAKALGYSGPKPRTEKVFWYHSIPETIHHEQIHSDRNVGHLDYVDSGRRPRRMNAKQKARRSKVDAAANFADHVMRGDSHPSYPL